MLSEIFYWLFNMSIAGAICGIVILLIRYIKKIPRRFIDFLWIIPFLRMCIPIGIGSKYGLMALISRFTTKSVVIYEWGSATTLSSTNFVMAANRYYPITYKTELLEQVFKIASLVWIVIAILLLITYGILYMMTLKEMKDSEFLRDNIFLSDKIIYPAVYGIISPKIILPYAYKKKELSFILLHENIHIERKDNLKRIIAFIIVAVHWFNPLVWVFLKYYLADLELSCDEKLLSECGEEKKKAYALSLVESMESKNIFASPFGGSKMRTRIDSILSYRKLSVLSMIGFSALVIVVAYVLLTNAR